jgi:2-dehydropantoate 2-reductase
MLQDVEQGRRTEIGALNEAVAAEGARLGVPTPFNRAVSALIRDLETRRTASLER